MMVALGAFKADTEKYLPDQRCYLAWLAAIAKDNRRAKLMSAALSGEQFTGKLVERFVFPKAFANPLIEQQDAFDAHSLRVGSDEVAPLSGPVVGIIRILQQPLNEPIPLVRERIIQDRKSVV